MLGELRLGRRRGFWSAKVNAPFQHWLGTVQHRKFSDWDSVHSDCEALSRLTESFVDIPALPGNELELLTETDEITRSLIRDIDAAKHTCHLEFYIWNEGGLADEVAGALLRATARGVICRVLLDDLGSRAFLRSKAAQSLRDQGVQVVSALQVGFLLALFVRHDLRLHRKIVVIDDAIAYTGSQNMVDPRFFKQDSGVGQWVDAMIRLRGPSVGALAQIFFGDWQLESGETIQSSREKPDHSPPKITGGAGVQVIPSGPLFSNDGIRKILLMAFYSARREVILTTPYFVPDESLTIALCTAALRGVEVTLIVPEQVDSRLVQLANQCSFEDLEAAGVKIARFTGGLLHTKSITVDSEFSFFGSLNLDQRSLNLNFEVTLLTYDRDFTKRLRDLQLDYLAHRSKVRSSSAQRGYGSRLAANTARLLGPLL